MSYEKQDFVDGEILTAAQLNHMEDGIDARLVVYELSGSSSASHDLTSIATYAAKGGSVVFETSNATYTLSYISDTEAIFNYVNPDGNAVDSVIIDSSSAITYKTQELSASAGMVVTEASDTDGVYIATHTFDEIAACVAAGGTVVFNNGGTICTLSYVDDITEAVFNYTRPDGSAVDSIIIDTDGVITYKTKELSGGAGIDDSTVSADTTWSSEKIFSDCVHHSVNNHVGGCVNFKIGAGSTIDSVITTVSPGKADYVQKAFRDGVQWEDQTGEGVLYGLRVPLPMGTYTLRLQFPSWVEYDGCSAYAYIETDGDDTCPEIIIDTVTGELQEIDFTLESECGDMFYFVFADDSGVYKEIKVLEIIGTPEYPMDWQAIDEIYTSVKLTVVHENGTKSVVLSAMNDLSHPLFMDTKINWVTGQTDVTEDSTFAPVDFSDVTGEVTLYVEMDGIYVETETKTTSRLTANEAMVELKADIQKLMTAVAELGGNI